MKWSSKSLVVVYLSSIFAAGAVSGWVVAERRAKAEAITAPRPDEISQSFKNRLCSRIQLSEDQQKKIERIIERSSAELQSIHSDHIKSLRQALSSRDSQIKGLLNPEQQELFAQLLRDRHERWKGKKSGDKARWEGKSRPGSRGDSPKSKNPAECPTNTPAKDTRGESATNEQP